MILDNSHLTLHFYGLFDGNNQIQGHTWEGDTYSCVHVLAKGTNLISCRYSIIWQKSFTDPASTFGFSLWLNSLLESCLSGLPALILIFPSTSSEKTARAAEKGPKTENIVPLIGFRVSLLYATSSSQWINCAVNMHILAWNICLCALSITIDSFIHLSPATWTTHSENMVH